MGRLTALGIIALISSAAAAPALCGPCGMGPPDPCQNGAPTQPCEPSQQPANEPCNQIPQYFQPQAEAYDSQATPCGDGTMKVQLQRSVTAQELEQLGFQPYPTSSGTLFVKPSCDAMIQPPSILVQIPQQQAVVPPAMTVQPPALQPITPPAVFTRPPPLQPIQPPPIQVRVPTPAPINPPPICVKVPPLPCIQPPPISVKPPTPAPICPPPITIRQPCLGPIQPPSICIPTYEFLRGQAQMPSPRITCTTPTPCNPCNPCNPCPPLY